MRFQSKTKTGISIGAVVILLFIGVLFLALRNLQLLMKLRHHI